MSDETPFGGFPAVGKATVIPNIFFATVLPRLKAPGELLAFLWALRLIQEQPGEVRFVTVAQLLAHPGAAESFAALGGGEDSLASGLDRCAEVGALLALDLVGAGGEERVYFVNNPGSRRAVGRAHAGELRLRPEMAARAPQAEARPGIFRLYEENIGTITPLVGERLLFAAEEYPWPWILDAFREAAELNRRNWRYIERILQNRAQEGARDETVGRDPLEVQRDRYLGGTLGHIVRNR